MHKEINEYQPEINVIEAETIIKKIKSYFIQKQPRTISNL